MPQDHKQFTVTDPRTFEGDPYEAAERACAQIEGVLAVAADLLPATRIIVRNAELERQMLDGEPRPLDWEHGPHGKRFDAIGPVLEALRKELRLQKQAAGFNPTARV